jgi:hypothetical protein
MYKGKDMRCEGCNTYSDLRVDMDLSDEDDMIGYFRKVLKRVRMGSEKGQLSKSCTCLC